MHSLLVYTFFDVCRWLYLVPSSLTVTTLWGWKAPLRLRMKVMKASPIDGVWVRSLPRAESTLSFKPTSFWHRKHTQIWRLHRDCYKTISNTYVLWSKVWQASSFCSKLASLCTSKLAALFGLAWNSRIAFYFVCLVPTSSRTILFWCIVDLTWDLHCSD